MPSRALSPSALALVGVLAAAAPAARAQEMPVSPEPEPAASVQAASDEARPVLTLEAARTMLRERSTELVVQDYAIEQAALLEDTARAVLLPSLNLAAQYTFRDREVVFSQGNAYAPLLPYLETVYQTNPELQQFFADNPDAVDARDLATAELPPVTVQFRHDYRITATLAQTLFNARAFPLLDQAETTYLQGESARRQIVYQLEASLQALYFRALVAQRFIGVNERNLELETLAYERAVAAFEEEVGNRFEVNRAEVRLRRAELELANARREYDVALEELALLLNADEPFDVEAPSDLGVPGDFEALVEVAMAHRPEVEGLDLSVRLAEERVSETRATWWPTVIATAEANVVRESAFSGDAFSWSIGVLLNWDIWDGGLRVAETESRELALAQQEARRTQIGRDIESELRRTWIQVESQRESVETARAESELAVRNVELTQGAFELGAATQLEVETARTQAFLAELSLASSETALQAQLYELSRLTGQGLEDSP